MGFEGVDFSSLHLSKPPGVDVESLGDAKDPIWAKHPDMMPGLGPSVQDRLLRDQIENGSDAGSDGGSDIEEIDQSDAGSEIGNIGDISDEERSRLLELQK